MSSYKQHLFNLKQIMLWWNLIGRHNERPSILNNRLNIEMDRYNNEKNAIK